MGGNGIELRRISPACLSTSGARWCTPPGVRPMWMGAPAMVSGRSAPGCSVGTVHAAPGRWSWMSCAYRTGRRGCARPGQHQPACVASGPGADLGLDEGAVAHARPRWTRSVVGGSQVGALPMTAPAAPVKRSLGNAQAHVAVGCGKMPKALAGWLPPSGWRIHARGAVLVDDVSHSATGVGHGHVQPVSGPCACRTLQQAAATA